MKRSILLISLLVLTVFPGVSEAILIRNIDNAHYHIILHNSGEPYHITLHPGGVYRMNGPSIQIEFNGHITRTRPHEEYMIKRGKLHLQRRHRRNGF